MSWKEIKDFPDYFINNSGLVMSTKRKRIINYLKPEKTNRGYLQVQLSKKNKRQRFRIHRLVAEAFIPNPNPLYYTEVNHKDGNKENNHIENLEWVTESQNKQHAYDIGLYPSREKHGRAKLSDNEVKLIRKLWNTGNYTQRELWERFNVSRPTVQRIIYGIQRSTT